MAKVIVLRCYYLFQDCALDKGKKCVAEVRKSVKNHYLRPVMKSRKSVKFSVEQSGAKMRIANGSWSALPSSVQYGVNSDGDIQIDGLTQFNLEITDDDLYQLVNNGGLVLVGNDFTLTEIILRTEK